MAIAGGVLLSTVVSFYLVPPLYTLLMHPKRHFFRYDQFQHDQFQHNQFEPDEAPQNTPALDTLSSEAP
jgi:multidrug efflux pump subunit AcrB